MGRRDPLERSVLTAGSSWHAAGGFHALNVTSAHAGTSADLASGSPSAAVFTFGLRGLLVKTAAGFRVHVESPWLETLLAWLDGA
jgi:hypothetical protein